MNVVDHHIGLLGNFITRGFYRQTDVAGQRDFTAERIMIRIKNSNVAGLVVCERSIKRVECR